MTPTREKANGKWHGILPQLGVPASALSGKHCPCPMCGGTDRFRFSNLEGNGTYICSQCGSGDALDLLMGVTGKPFKDCAQDVDRLCPDIERQEPKKALSDERRVELLNSLYAQCAPSTLDDLSGIYLKARGFDWVADDLMFCRACRAPDGTTHPAMVAMVRDVFGTPVSMHRTFLARGSKADIKNPRALMGGKLPDGACVRLTPVAEHIGVAEGIETAMAAKKKFGVPTWSTLNTAIMKKWEAPQGVKKVTIFGDNDQKFGGQASAYHLAHRLAVKGISVNVRIAPEVNSDWADEV